MADNEQNQGQQQGQKQKGGGGGGGAQKGVTLVQNHTYAAGQSYGEVIKGAIVDSVSYTVSAIAALAITKGLAILIAKVTGGKASPIFPAPRVQGGNNQHQQHIEAAPAEHPMALVNRLLKEDPDAARKMQSLLNQRLAEVKVPVPAAPIAEVAPVVEAASDAPLLVMTAFTIPETPVTTEQKGENRQKNRHSK